MGKVILKYEPAINCKKKKKKKKEEKSQMQKKYMPLSTVNYWKRERRSKSEREKEKERERERGGLKVSEKEIERERDRHRERQTDIWQTYLQYGFFFDGTGLVLVTDLSQYFFSFLISQLGIRQHILPVNVTQ